MTLFSSTNQGYNLKGCNDKQWQFYQKVDTSWIVSQNILQTHGRNGHFLFSSLMPLYSLRATFDPESIVYRSYVQFLGKWVCAQLHLILCHLMDSSPPVSSIHGTFQARILEWTAISFSRGSFGPRDWTCISWVSCIGRQILYHRFFTRCHLGSPWKVSL